RRTDHPVARLLGRQDPVRPAAGELAARHPALTPRPPAADRRAHRGELMIALYHSPRTRSVRVLWLLEQLGIPYELRTMAFTPETLKGPEYAKVNPLGKVPSIQDGTLTMFESGAIVEYLVERYGDGRLAPPVGSPE